jgi:hypothetical protein
LEVRRQSIAYLARPVSDEAQLQNAIRSPVSDTLQLCAPNRTQHFFELDRRLRLSLDEAVRGSLCVLESSE